MDDSITIKVFEVVGSPFCVAADDGQVVYERIATVLSSRRNVSLSFANVTSLTSAFLNTAIGQLYNKFAEEEIRVHLRVRDMSDDDTALLKRVVDTAKQYFKDPVRFTRAKDDVMGRR